jgi:hypothetical protein
MVRSLCYSVSFLTRFAADVDHKRWWAGRVPRALLVLLGMGALVVFGTNLDNSGILAFIEVFPYHQADIEIELRELVQNQVSGSAVIGRH